MSLAIVYTRAKCGVDAPLVNVETHLSNGLPSLNIVGLPETAVRESKDRVRSAIINSYFEFPTRRITINLAPADLPKEGGRYDLAIALGILAASGQVPVEALQQFEFIGELGLTGEIRAVQGALPAAIKCSEAQRTLVVPLKNANETRLCRYAKAIAAKNLLQLCAHLHSRETIAPLQPASEDICASTSDYPDLCDIKGQQQAKRVLEIAAAGGHNVIFSGPPGTGKTLLATRLPGILPPLTQEELLEVATMFSITGQQPANGVYERPFRNPHHSASAVALVGGGSRPHPGEISLSHHGVLFLDEVPEFHRHVLEVLREPMESGEILICRANQRIRFPARFQLVAAMNPCPCGYYQDPDRACCCTAEQIRRYHDKLSGPFLDRIDLQMNVMRLPATMITQAANAESSEQVRSRVIKARQRQIQRVGKSNASLVNKEIEMHCALLATDKKLLEQAVVKFKLSPRAYHRVLRVARTIADLDEQAQIHSQHINEALAYRTMHKQPV